MAHGSFWDKQAAKYAKSDIRDMAAYETGLDYTKRHLTSDMDVMEFGAGTGMTALRLAPHVKTYLATDVSAGLIAECEKRKRDFDPGNVTFRQAVLSDTDFTPERFDAVLGFNILHLLRNQDQALANVHKMLKPGGLMITKTPCLPERFHLKFSAMLMVGRVISLFNRDLYFHIAKIPELDATIEKAGFKIIETGCFPKAPSPGRYIVAQKV